MTNQYKTLPIVKLEGYRISLNTLFIVLFIYVYLIDVQYIHCYTSAIQAGSGCIHRYLVLCIYVELVCVCDFTILSLSVHCILVQ